MFAERLISLLKEKKITSAKMLSDLGLGKNQITYWKKNGNVPSATTVEKIAKYLNVSTDYLLGNEQKNSDDSELNSAFFRLKKGLEPYNLDEEDAEFLLTVFKAHKEKNK